NHFPLSSLPAVVAGLVPATPSARAGAGSIEVAGTSPATTRERWQVGQHERERCSTGAGIRTGIGTGISKRKLRANRLGKPAGTGPTSAAGKARSAQNARKHGLNVPVMHDPDVAADVALMTQEIAPGCQDAELIGRARRIAEAQVDLMRVARAR